MKNNRSVRISRLSYLYFITMCLSLPLIAQVTIKEKVVITPKQSSHTAQSSANTLRVVFTYTGNVINYLPQCGSSFLTIIAQTCHGQTPIAQDTIKSSPTTVTLNSVEATTYQINAHVHYWNSTFTGTVSVYLDDTVLVNEWTTNPPCSFCNNSYQCNCACSVGGVTYLTTGYSFSSKSTTVTHGSSSGFNLNNNGTYYCPSTTVWNNALPVALNIIQGAELGSFYKGGVKVGSSVIGKKNSSNAVDSVSFVADGRQPCSSNGDTVVITATSNGITDTTKFVVTKSGTFTHFGVTITPDTVSTCQPGTITAIAKDANDSAAFLACTTLLKLTATNGRFIRGSDTLASPLDSIPYGDVRSGNIGVIPQTFSYSSATEQVIVTVKKSSDTTKTGRDTVVFAIPIDLQVSVSQNPLRPLETGAPNQTTVTVKATRCNVPVNGLAISLEVHPVANSGGHTHNVNRPKGTLANGGTTNAQGEFSTPYTSSKFGGEEWIVASSSTTSDKESVMVTIKIPDLSPITSGTGNILTVTSESAAQFHQLEYSDYATSTTRDAVYTAVRQYAQEFELSSAIFLAVNDMSLPNGGLFDIGGNWSSPHDWHRLGKSVDFSHFYRLANGHVTNIIFYRDGVPYDTTNTIDESKLDKFFKDLKPIGFSRHEKDIGLIHYQSKESGIVK